MRDEGLTKYTLRMPEDLHRALMDASAKSGRSLNSEMVHRLEASFEGSDFGAVVRALVAVGEKVTFVSDRVAVLEKALLPIAMKLDEQGADPGSPPPKAKRRSPSAAG